ncbi:hypothetical protein PCE1_004801 [Barthelona sp. PCE]
MAEHNILTKIEGHVIQDIWMDNVEFAMKEICFRVQQYPYIGIDTEFPGLVYPKAADLAKYKDQQLSPYARLRMNVDRTRIIQLGLTLSDEHGNLPHTPPHTWQINFVFNIEKEEIKEDAHALLIEAGIDFSRHATHGVDHKFFGYLLNASNLLYNRSIKWVSFHSGFDFGYLLKVATNSKMPRNQESFLVKLRTLFNDIYDIKHLMSSTKLYHRGLQHVADSINIKRVGEAHLAGSDSMVTLAVFLRMMQPNIVEEYSVLENLLDPDDNSGPFL